MNNFNCKDYFLNNFNLKHLFISFDELIVESLNEGNMHFFLTINFSKNIKNKEKIEKEIIKLEKLIIEIDLWSWHLIVSEKNKNENYHLHLILSVRSCIGYNDIIENNILFYIRNNFEIDTKINFCLKFLDIKKTLKYLFKEFEKLNNNDILQELNDNKIVRISILIKQFNIFKYLNKYFKIHLFQYKEKIDKKTKLIENELENKFENKNDKINLIYKENSNFFNTFKGVKIDKKEYSEKQTIFIWNLFLTLNELYIYKNSIYKKIKKFNISYEIIITDEYLYNNFITIIDFLKNKLYFHFNNFDNSNYYSNFLKNKEEKLERLKNYTNNILYPNFYLMEFTDGIYSILNNKFIKKENLSLLKDMQTIKHYNYTYKHLSLPSIWLNGVKNVLNIKIDNNIITKIINNIINLDKNNKNNLNTLIDLLIYIAYVFHFSSNILNKKNTMYIWGPSNTGKTTLIIDLFINYFGKENVGLLSSNKNFSYQDILDKLILILDEFDISTIKTEDFKKIINKELILGEKKNKEPQIIKPTPIIISSNKNIINEPFLENKDSIINRLKIIHFNTPILEEEMDFNIKEKIKNEEAKIIILCNKIYFNFLKNKEEKLENLKLDIKEDLNK